MGHFIPITLGGHKMYPSDLKDEEWKLIKPFFKRPDPRGNPGFYEKSTIVNGIYMFWKEGLSGA
jgi:transposase